MRYIVGQFSSGVYPFEETDYKDYIEVEEIPEHHIYNVYMLSKCIGKKQLGVYTREQLSQVIEKLARWLAVPEIDSRGIVCGIFVMPTVEWVKNEE